MQLWHRSLLLIISQHALGRVPPSSARPAKDPPPPSEFCNHTPHSPAAPRHWMLETNTLSVFDVWPGSASLITAPEPESLALTTTAGCSNPPSQQTATGQPIKICTLRGEQTEEARVSVILLDFQLLNCYQQE